MDNIPLGSVFLIVVAITFLFVECGFRLGKRRMASHEPEPPLASMLASTLGLLAFLLAFTFNIAANRFDERRTLVLNEANAIGTTYLRADFLNEPLRQDVKKLLREYVATRVSCLSSGKLESAITTSEVLQERLWSDAVTAANQNVNSPMCALFVASLNEVIDIHAKRVTLGLHTRVPPSVWLCLLSVAALSMTGVGYFSGLTGTRCWAGTSVLIASFSLVMLLVADLDRPHQGLLKTPQQPLIDLCRKLGPP